ncbi:MAG: peptidase S8, partial [Alcanivoracaceae bacterium]|nr:peptidase S8 [Alcanivoracaceae bacterium]
MNLKMKTVYVATMLALGATASAERMIVSYNDNGQGVKNGHQVLVDGNNWFAVELDDHGKSAMRAAQGFKSMEVDAVRTPFAIFNDDLGDPNLQQITPYAIYQSEANQLTLQLQAG